MGTGVLVVKAPGYLLSVNGEGWSDGYVTGLSTGGKGSLNVKATDCRPRVHMEGWSDD